MAHPPMHSFHRPALRRALSAGAAFLLATTSVIAVPVSRIVPPATAAASGSFADAHFADFPAFTNLYYPTTVRFASDGRAFVAEKRGIIREYDSLDSSAPDATVLDIRGVVDDYWDRGLLSIALDPDFLNGRNYIYVYYDYDAPPGQTAPVWNDACPTPPGPTTDGCVVRSKLDRYTVNLSTNVASPGSRLNLIGDAGNGEWCQQFPSHAGGALAFDSAGMLLVTGGDGASFGNDPDYGQLGGSSGSPTPANPCGDPVPGFVKLTAEGGMLRAQDVRTQADPTGLDGTIARIDPDTGNAPADNPMKDFAGADQNTKRIVATGFRNPFRMTFRPGHGDLYVGDVGNQTWEEIDRWTMSGSTPTNIPNYGWPCYEGAGHHQFFEDVGTKMCDDLYDDGQTAPLYAYTHVGSLTPKGPCFPGSADQTSSISGLAFYGGASGSSIDYPSKYDGALFFVDYSRDCLGAILPQSNGIPDPSKVEQIATGIASPVDLVTGPGGDLYYVDFDGGRVMRVKYLNSPTARAVATPNGGKAPIDIHLDGSTSSDPDSDATITDWDWDFNNDGSIDESGVGGRLAHRHARAVQGQADRAQLQRAVRQCDPEYRREQRSTHPRDQLAGRLRRTRVLGRRRQDQHQRERVGPRGRNPQCRAPRLDRDPAPLPGGLPHPHDPVEVEHQVLYVRRARPRLSVIPRDPPHGYGRQRHLGLGIR